MRSLLTALAVCACCLAAPAGAQATREVGNDPAEASAATRAARVLFVERWEEVARLHPEFATLRGDTRYGHLWTDASPAGIARADAWWSDLGRRAKAIDMRQLSPSDRVSLLLLIHEADERVALQKHDGFRSMSVSAAPFAFQGSFARLLQSSPTATRAQVEQILTRMRTYPQLVEQEIARMRGGAQLGWVPARPSLATAVAQLDVLLAPEPDASPFLEPFRRLGDGMPDAERATLRRQAAEALEREVLPAVRRLRDFVAGEYMAAAPPEGGLARYPQGAEVYAILVRSHTTTAMTPREVHDLGVREVTRLRAEMEAVMRGTGFKGDFAAFLTFLHGDPQFYFPSGEALLAAYREIAKRIDPELPKLFAELPRAPYGIRAMPAFMGEGAAESYSSPSVDGRRPGWFNANALGYRIRPRWQLEALTAHETVPGHHLQSARALELRDIPDFRRVVFFTAYSEGWALYAETLGPELGLYTDPYSRFGFLQYQMWRAVRLVVDTGIHAFGWTRQQAIDYLRANTGMALPTVTSEIDRYYSWPGQALAYMVGQQKLIELRDRSRAALGPRFDIRAFHNVVLDAGQVPLGVLDTLVADWVAAQRADGTQNAAR